MLLFLRIQVNSFCHVPPQRRSGPVILLKKLCTCLFTALGYAWQAPAGIHCLNRKREKHTDIHMDLWEDFLSSAWKKGLNRSMCLLVLSVMREWFFRAEKKRLEHTSLASGDYGGCQVPEFIWPQTV